MPAFDDEQAKAATSEFAAILARLKQSSPSAFEELQREWKRLYLIAGHKRLGRIMIGMTPEQACRTRGVD